MPQTTPVIDRGPVLGVEGAYVKAVFLLPEVTLVWTMAPDTALRTADTLVALARQARDARDGEGRDIPDV
jgi:hypothetical protein